MDHARGVAERAGSLEVIALGTFTRGFAHYMGGKFRRAIELLDESRRAMTEDCRGMAYEVVTAQWALLNCVSFLGELEQLRKRRPEYIRDATERGDLYGLVNLRIGPSSIAWLVDDEPDEGRAELADVMGRWTREAKGGFQSEHFTAMYARVGIELYAGRPGEAHAAVVAQWSALRRSLLLTVQINRVLAHAARGCSALAAAEAFAGDRSHLLATAGRAARALQRERCRWAVPLGKLLAAGVSLVRWRDVERASALLEEAADLFEGAEMALHAATARRCHGKLLGGEAGGARVVAAERWMSAQGVKSPPRMSALIAPGLPSG
jgi:hypothetical protein